MEDLAQKLKEFRISTGLSQSEIAEKLDIPQTTWSGYERGRSNPSVNEQDYAGHFPLEEAVTKCCPVEILQYLVAQDADINPKIDSVNSEPPLLRAVGMQEASTVFDKSGSKYKGYRSLWSDCSNDCGSPS